MIFLIIRHVAFPSGEDQRWKMNTEYSCAHTLLVTTLSLQDCNVSKHLRCLNKCQRPKNNSSKNHNQCTLIILILLSSAEATHHLMLILHTCLAKLLIHLFRAREW